MTNKLDSAKLKIDRTYERIAELSETLKKDRPFRYVVETDYHTQKRSCFAKRNEPVIGRCAIIIGDALANIRSALDHAYWEIVSPFAKTPKEEKAVQFPFSETANRLNEAVANRLAPRVGAGFRDAIIALAPHGESGGNNLLWLIDKVQAGDKHRGLPPTADYKRYSSADIQRTFPDFPGGVTDFRAVGNHIDFVWPARSRVHPGTNVGPWLDKFERDLDLPIEIVLPVGALHERRPVIPFLNAMTGVADDAIRIIRDAAK